MRFNGKSGVEVRLPSDLDDLKGYTSLSLFLQRPEPGENGGTENMFVMYLGNRDVSAALAFPLFLRNMGSGARDPAGPCHRHSRRKSRQHASRLRHLDGARGLRQPWILPAAELGAFHVCTVSTCTPGPKVSPSPVCPGQQCEGFMEPSRVGHECTTPRAKAARTLAV